MEGSVFFHLQNPAVFSSFFSFSRAGPQDRLDTEPNWDKYFDIVNTLAGADKEVANQLGITEAFLNQLYLTGTCRGGSDPAKRAKYHLDNLLSQEGVAKRFYITLLIHALMHSKKNPRVWLVSGCSAWDPVVSK